MTPGGGAAGDHQHTKPDSANRLPFESLLTRRTNLIIEAAFGWMPIPHLTG